MSTVNKVLNKLHLWCPLKKTYNEKIEYRRGSGGKKAFWKQERSQKPLPADNLIKYKKKHTPKNNILWTEDMS